ncbi:hypothetical protein COO60DRAFT_1516370, partial [Scenedesmus sp. NREL 46B-D3]
CLLACLLACLQLLPERVWPCTAECSSWYRVVCCQCLVMCLAMVALLKFVCFAQVRRRDDLGLPLSAARLWVKQHYIYIQ